MIDVKYNETQEITNLGFYGIEIYCVLPNKNITSVGSGQLVKTILQGSHLNFKQAQ